MLRSERRCWPPADESISSVSFHASAYSLLPARKFRTWVAVAIKFHGVFAAATSFLLLVPYFKIFACLAWTIYEVLKWICASANSIFIDGIFRAWIQKTFTIFQIPNVTILALTLAISDNLIISAGNLCVLLNLQLIASSQNYNTILTLGIIRYGNVDRYLLIKSAEASAAIDPGKSFLAYAFFLFNVKNFIDFTKLAWKLCFSVLFLVNKIESSSLFALFFCYTFIVLLFN